MIALSGFEHACGVVRVNKSWESHARGSHNRVKRVEDATVLGLVRRHARTHKVHAARLFLLKPGLRCTHELDASGLCCGSCVLLLFWVSR